MQSWDWGAATRSPNSAPLGGSPANHLHFSMSFGVLDPRLMRICALPETSGTLQPLSGALVQTSVVSTVQVGEQPSPGSRLPSSQFSPQPLWVTASPHGFGLCCTHWPLPSH